MSDFEDLDFFLKSWISEEKRKRRKDLKRDKKQKNRIKNDANVKKKKKKPKESLEVGKENKKEKKKKKKKVDDEEPEASDQTSEKKTKRKKKVLFDLSPKYIRATRPKLTSERLQDESQSNSDDINSQDLFITQKTFRTSPEETCSGEPSSPQNISTSSQHLQQDFWKPKTEENKLESNITEKKTVKLKAVNPFLDHQVIVLDPPKENFCSSQLPSTTNVSTQTENFFTTELSSYLRFCRNVPATDLKPLDLSLPRRKHLDSCLIEDKDEEEEEEEQRTPGEDDDRDLLLSGSSQQRDAGLKKKSSGPPASRLQLRSIDTTSSSEDSEAPGRRLDLNQVRAVQMRLNESFFFKTKGDGGSPRPESPLMKLALGRDVKKRKIR